MIFPLQFTVNAEDIDDGVIWILLGESPLLDRSSKYMHKGKTDRGLRYARKALQRKLTPQGRQIAHHNLCLGYVAQDAMEKASQHCQFAEDTMPSGLHLKRVTRGLYRVTSYRSAEVEQAELGVILARNLEIHGMTAEKSRVAQLSSK